MSFWLKTNPQLRSRLPLLLLVFTVIFSNFLFIINTGIFWDDWVLVSLDDNNLFEMWRQTGNPYLGYLYWLLLKTPYPLIFHRLCFLALNLLCAFSIFFIFKKTIIKNSFWAFWASMFFVLAPMNLPKITLICFSFILCLTLFLVAFYLTISFQNKPIVRLLSLFFFMLSFVTNSLISFYALVLFSLFLDDFPNFRTINKSSVYLFIRKNVDYLALPLFFLLFKFFIVNKPYGAYGNYNSIHFRPMMILEPFLVFYNVLGRIFSTDYTTIGALCTLLIYFFIKRIVKSFHQKPSVSLDSTFIMRMFLFTSISLVFGILPYLMVGRSASSFGQEWQNRDELLLPITLALFLTLLSAPILTRVDKIFASSLAHLIAPIFICITFALGGINDQISLLADTIKQDSIKLFLAENKEIRFRKTFYFNDLAVSSNVFARRYRPYEINGMAAQIFKNQIRHFMTGDIYKYKDIHEFCPNDSKVLFICKDWVPNQYILFINVKKSPSVQLDRITTLELSLLKITQRDRYYERVRELFLFDVHAERVDQISTRIQTFKNKRCQEYYHQDCIN